jgi:ferric enterobactin receptor
MAPTRERTYTRETHDIDNGFNQVEEYRAAWKSQFKSGIFTSEAGAGWTSNRYTYNFFASRLYDALQIDSISSSTSLNL